MDGPHPAFPSPRQSFEPRSLFDEDPADDDLFDEDLVDDDPVDEGSAEQPQAGQTMASRPSDGQPQNLGQPRNPGHPQNGGQLPSVGHDQNVGQPPNAPDIGQPHDDGRPGNDHQHLDKEQGIESQTTTPGPELVEEAEHLEQEVLIDDLADPGSEPGAPGQPGSGSDAERVGPTGRPIPELPEPTPPAPGPKRAFVLSMCNQKGGVGKTTTTINLGAALAETGRKVLLVDFDPQGSLSVGLGVNPHTLETSVYNLLMERNVDIDEVIDETVIEGMDILPSNIDLSAAEVQLVSEVAREQILSRVLDRVRDRYDVILIDCAPSLGLLTINALTASDGVIMPLECEFFALRGIALLTDTITKVQERLNPRLQVVGILGTMFDGRTLHSREVLERVVQAFGETVFHTVIRRTIKFPETTVAGEPITTYASSSPGARAYRDLAREVLLRCHTS